MMLEDEPLRSNGINYASGEEQMAIINSSRKNEAAGPKWKWRLVVDVSGGKSKVWCCKEHYCIGIWNVRSMSQSKLDMVNQEMEWLNVNLSGISELKWMGMGELVQMIIISATVGKCPLEEVALKVNKRVWNTVHGCNLKNNRMILLHFQVK